MSTCETQVFVSNTQCNVIEVCTAGPLGPTGPQGNPGPTGPGGGVTGPTGPPGASSAPIYNNSITANVPSGTTDNYSPFGYVGGVTNQLTLAPTDSTSTLLGLSALGVPNGFTLMIWNSSPTLYLVFANQASGTPSNQFACGGNVDSALPPFGHVIIVYLGGQWVV